MKVDLSWLQTLLANLESYFATLLPNIAGPLGTLVASFAGAFFAFQFNRYLKDKERKDNEIAAGHRALYHLVNMWNSLRQYQIVMIERYRTREDRWLNFPAGSSLPNGPIMVDAKDLTFVLQSTPSAFFQVFLEVDRFLLVRSIIDDRNRLVRGEVFPALSKANVGLNEPRTDAEMKAILGTGLVRQLTVFTDAIINNVDEDVISSRDAFEKLRAALKKAHPKAKFILFPKEAGTAEVGKVTPK